MIVKFHFNNLLIVEFLFLKIIKFVIKIILIKIITYKKKNIELVIKNKEITK